MGFIHYNCSVAEQAAMVAKVKAHNPGFVVNAVCMAPSTPISALDNLKVGTAINFLRGGAHRGGPLPNHQWLEPPATQQLSIYKVTSSTASPACSGVRKLRKGVHEPRLMSQ
jgi:hypothetical protein